MKFKAYIKWGQVAEYPENVPAIFLEIQRIIATGNADQVNSALEMITPLLGASFVPANIMGIDDLLDDEDDIEAESVSVTHIAWPDGAILPNICAEAIFTIPLSQSLTAEELGDWQEENDNLDNGVSFYFQLDDDGDGSLSEHEGLGLTLIG